MYYDTTKISGDYLQELEKNTELQESKIWAFFKQHPRDSYTPFEVWQALNWQMTPITSIRRAITNLTKAGALLKLEMQRPGEFGKPNFTWKLATNDGPQLSFGI